MDPFYLDLKDKQENIVLNVGDMLIDNVSLSYGILLSRERRITIEDDDIYIWKIYWSTPNHNSDIVVNQEENNNSHVSYLEEVGLKISIIIDYFELIIKE